METTSISENQKGTNDEDVHMQDLTKPNENGDALDKSRNNDVISNNDLKENKFISVASNKIYLSTSQIMTKILLGNSSFQCFVLFCFVLLFINYFVIRE